MIPVIEYLIDELEDFPGVFAISLVEKPAIKSNFVALSAQEVQMQVIDEDKRMVLGLALIPDIKIPRIDDQGEKYFGTFSKETIRKASELYLSRLRPNNTTYEHEVPVDGVSLSESWIVEDKEKDKTALYGIDAPLGSWAIAMKVENEDVWKKVKEGEVLGFSIEGIFNEKKKDRFEEMWNAIKSILNG